MDIIIHIRKTVLLLVCILSFFGVSAAPADSAKIAKRQQAVSHLKQHFKLYGFIRNYFTYDSRESISGQGDLYNYQPLDERWNQTELEAQTSGIARQDLNAIGTFRFLSITTRVGVDIMDYKWRGMEIGGKIEADFYAALTMKNGQTHTLSGVAQLRLRQAYITLGWDSLRMNDKDFARVDLMLGQAWHPMAADLCDVIALASGAPFGPFNRSPQVRMDARLGRYFTLTATGLWQMQYLSTGPEKQSGEYIAYSKTPEAYLGISVHDKGWLARAGVDVLSISPRHLGSVTDNNGKTVSVRVNDRITTVSPFLYLQYKKDEFSIKAKTVLAEAGEHMNLDGGYGVRATNQDGSWSYTPLRQSASWVSIVYGGRVGQQEEKHPQKLQGILFAGYVHNLGTKDALLDADNDGMADMLWTPRPANMRQMWRLSPTLQWTIGKFQLGCEYEITSVRYGDFAAGDLRGLAGKNLHWVTNHRVQLMTRFNF